MSASLRVPLLLVMILGLASHTLHGQVLPRILMQGNSPDSMVGTIDDPNVPGGRLPLPAGLTVAMLQSGDSLFHAGSCAKCHGANAEGGPRAPSLVSGAWLQHKGDFRDIVATIADGVAVGSIKDSTHKLAMNPRGGPMKLTDDQIRLVAGYVWTISRKKQ